MMRFLYTLLAFKTWCLLHFVMLFSPKIKLFVRGRKGTFKTLKNRIKDTDRIVWFHAASMGEFEQGLPVIKAFKEHFSGYTILLTFFSPSGYEINKNKDVADIITYLPFDTALFAKRFLNIVKPQMAFFIKYEFWPNYMHYLKERGVETFLVSAIFRQNQIFFKKYGGGAKTWLKTFSHIFTQDETSQKLLSNIGITNVTVSGDTRFDRVFQLLKFPELDFAKKFKGDALCVVLGSTYPEDEALFMPHINSIPQGVKYIIVPHNINSSHIKSLEALISKKVAVFSRVDMAKIGDYDVLLLDAVGYLSKLYRQADIAYVGGGMKKGGLHNILEAAVFGIPVLIAPYFSKFKEARDLVTLRGVSSISSKEEACAKINSLIVEPKTRLSQGKICSDYVVANMGATKKIVETLKKNHRQID